MEFFCLVFLRDTWSVLCIIFPFVYFKMSTEFLTERDQLRENLRSEIQNEVLALKQERDKEIQKIHKRFDKY